MPVQCGGILEGILTNPNNEAYNETFRIYTVTRFDAHYDFIYRTAFMLLRKPYNTTTTEAEDEAVLAEPESSSMFKVFERLSHKVMKFFKKLFQFDFKKIHNLIWNVGPVVIKILALVGNLLTFA